MPGPYRTPIPIPVIFCCLGAGYVLEYYADIPPATLHKALLLICLVLSLWQFGLCQVWIMRIHHALAQLSSNCPFTEVKCLALGYANTYILLHLRPSLVTLLLIATINTTTIDDVALVGLIAAAYWLLPAALALCQAPLLPPEHYHPLRYYLGFTDSVEADQVSQWLCQVSNPQPWTNMRTMPDHAVIVSPDLFLLLLESTLDLSEINIRTLPPLTPESSP